MEKITKKRQRVKKISKVVIPILAVIVVLSSTILPTYARANNNISPYSDVIRAGTDFNVKFLGVSPMNPNGDPSVYVSRDIMGGKIEMQGSADLSEFQLYHDEFVDRIQTELGHFDSNGVLTVVNKTVGRPIYGDWSILNQGHSVIHDWGYAGEGGNYVSQPYRVASLRYVDYLYMSSYYRPTGVVLTSNNLYLDRSTVERFGGYQGIRLQYMTDSRYWQNATYTFTCEAVGDLGQKSSIRQTGTLTRNGDDFGYDCYLVPADVVTRIYNEVGSWFQLNNIEMRVTFTDGIDIPTTSNDPSFAFATYQDVVVSDNLTTYLYEEGEIDSNQVLYNDYDWLLHQYIHALGGLSGGAGGGSGWQDGYDYGYGIGKSEGLIEGEIAGRTQGYADGLRDGKGLGFQDGKLEGIAEGYENGKSEGELIGYAKGKYDGEQIGKELGEQIGYDRGKSEGFDLGVASALDGMNFTEWLGVAVGGFLDFTLFGNVTIGGILGVCIAMALVMLFLKFFAGG